MSKVDAQRAMREAKYARERASGPTRAAVAAAAAAATGTARPEAVDQPEAAAAAKVRAAKLPETPAAAVGERCGHKSMNGRACTREAGHPEKNHRYS